MAGDVKRTQAEPLLLRVPPDFETEWPGSSAVATECLVNLVALVDQVERTVQRWGQEFDIPSVAALNVMDILRGAEQALPPSVIAERMMVSRATLTGVVATLERRGMVERTTHPNDGRMVLVGATPRGRHQATRFLELLHRVDRRILQVLPERDQRAFLHMIGLVRAALPTGSLREAAGPRPARS